MKRLTAACALLVFVLAANIAAYAAIDGATAGMSGLIAQARAQCAGGDYEDARATLDELDRTFSENTPLLLLFVRRDLFYEVDLANASLRAYACAQSKQDFDAEAERALRRIEVLRHTLLYVG
ncbi:MAG: DUF4363 family protein [Oscillospiraceae bacterium]|nr:DUF4363 family protein [Oscillospiraceae bacterium]